MSQLSCFLPVVRWPFADARLAPAHGKPIQLLRLVDRVTLLSVVGVLVGILVGGGLAAFVEERIRQLLVVQVAAQATDEVELGVLSRVTASDFDAPHTPTRLAELRARLAPVMSRVRRNGSEIVGVRLVARDGTIVYADSAERTGSSLAPSEWSLLASALEGQRSGSGPGWLSNTPADPTLKALYRQVLVVSVPVVSEGAIVGAYVIDLNLAAVDSVYSIVWAAFSAVFGLTLSLALRAALARDHKESVSHAPQHAAAVPKRAAICALARDHRLTPREQEVLRLLATTLTYQDMAAELSVSDETIRSHVKSILNKLGQPNRTQAVLVALRAGLLEVA